MAIVTARHHSTRNTAAAVDSWAAETVVQFTPAQQQQSSSSHWTRHLMVVDRKRPEVVPPRGQTGSPSTALLPALDDPASAMVLRRWLVQSQLLEAIARDALGDIRAAELALERALDVTEHDRVLLPFVVDPVPALLERHAGASAAHADLIREIFDLLAGRKADSPVRAVESLRDPLTESEMRVLRLLPTNLSKREIGNELFLSLNTIKAHTKHLYAKLDAHTRRQAVERARELGLLSLSSPAR
jgi:LuxR family transcriptional regulator, maltose regulon positive regulatory protein